MLKLIKLFFFSVFLMMPVAPDAQDCEVQQLVNDNEFRSLLSNVATGTNFFACNTGSIKSITINIDFFTTGGASGRLYISRGNSTDPTTAAYTQDFSVNATGDLTIFLTTPFPVLKDEEYAFSVTELGSTDFGLSGSSTDVNANINIFAHNIPSGTTGLGKGSAVDFTFSVSILSTIIPTLSQWGLIIFGLMVLCLGVILVGQREVSEAGTNGLNFQILKSTFEPSIYLNLLTKVWIAIAALFSIMTIFFGYEMTVWDLPGGLISGMIIAYMLFLGRKSA